MAAKIYEDIIMDKWLFSYGFIKNGYIHGIADEEKLLMKYDIANNEIKICPQINNMDYIEYYVAINQYVIALSKNGKKLYSFEVGYDSFIERKIDVTIDEYGNYAAITSFNNNAFIFTRKKRKVYIYDPINNQLKCNDLNQEMLLGVNIDEITWLITSDGKHFVKYDMKKEVYDVVDIDIAITNISHLTTDGIYIYILQVDGSIWRFSTSTYEISSIYKSESNKCVGRLIILKDKYIELPSIGEDIYIIEPTGTVVYQSYPDDFKYIGNSAWSKYTDSFIYNNTMYFANRSGNYILKIDVKDGEIGWIKPKLPSHEDYVKAVMKNNYFIYEGKILLKDYIKHL